MNKKGFTLIELLIVIVIIGILAAIAIPRFGETRERAYISAMQADLNQMQTAQELCYQDACSGANFTYSSDESELDITFSTGVSVASIAGDTENWAATLSHDATDTDCSYDTDPTSANPGTIVCAVP